MPGHFLKGKNPGKLRYWCIGTYTSLTCISSYNPGNYITCALLNHTWWCRGTGCTWSPPHFCSAVVVMGLYLTFLVAMHMHALSACRPLDLDLFLEKTMIRLSKVGGGGGRGTPSSWHVNWGGGREWGQTTEIHFLIDFHSFHPVTNRKNPSLILFPNNTQSVLHYHFQSFPLRQVDSLLLHFSSENSNKIIPRFFKTTENWTPLSSSLSTQFNPSSSSRFHF